MRRVTVTAPGTLGVALSMLAGTLGVLLLVAALHDVSKAWDVWAYHLPFAARIAGIVGPSSYVFGPENEARFQGFPLFAEALQGLFWRATGRPEAANLVSLVSLFALPLALSRLYGVSRAVALLAFLAIPLVQIHATAAYVDLPANVGVTILFLVVHRTLTHHAVATTRTLVLAAALAAAAANMKFQLVPATLLAAVVLFVDVVRKTRGAPRARAAKLSIFLLAVPVVLATPLKNTASYGNPVWPVELTVLGRTLPHADTAYASSPPHLEAASRPERFVRSVLEIDNRPIASRARWSVDQWTPPGETGYRMGGFFGAYALLNVVALAVSAVRKRGTGARAAALLFLAVTALASVMPQSHELRYYMHWMLLLVAFNLATWGREAEGACGVLAAAALAVVAWSTGFSYLYPSGESFESLVAARVDGRVLAATRAGNRICIAREPWTFLYAAPFHGVGRYVVLEATSEEACPGAQR